MTNRGSGGDEEVCANCEAPLAGPFCSRCGQARRDRGNLSLRQLAGEWLGDVFTFDSRLARTLGPLVRRPGHLTREYLAGRRVRYVPPLRLFVFLSLAMLLVMSLTGVRFSWRLTDSSGQELAASASRAESSPAEAGEAAAARGKAGGPGAAVEARGGANRFDPDVINRRLLDLMSQGMLLLVPVMALFLWLLHRRRSPFYVSHLIFALHVHSFWFLVTIAASLLDAPFAEARPGKILVLVTWVPYLYLAQRRVYGGGVWANVARTATLVTSHGIAFLMVMLGLLAVVARFG